MTNMLPVTILLFVTLSVGYGLQCKDENGNNVDWFSAYKSPKIHDSSDWKVREGLAHFYLDPHSPAWTLSDQPMNSSQQAVAITLQQIYQPQGSIMYIMYNDEGPDGSKSSKGHTKGVVAFDGTSGIWLVHSTPKFPPTQECGYSWPSNGRDFGQTFLCVSLPFAELGSVATQLLYNQPHIYDSKAPKHFTDSFPIITSVIAGKRPQGPPWSSIKKLTSIGGQNFLSFAKAKYFYADLYDDLVAPTLRQNLMVETWLRHEGTPLSSNCSATYKVLKIDSISLPNGVKFHESKDHAKWAVTTDQMKQKGKYVIQMLQKSSRHWACVGDINRMDSQFHRGGGTVCIEHTGMWKAYTESIGNYTSCK